MDFGEPSFHAVAVNRLRRLRRSSFDTLKSDLRRAPTMRGEEVRSSATWSLAKKEVLRMAAYVLVGGGWLGGWCWQRVARRLREEEHDAYPVPLTGLGERVHLASPQVDLETHITDVVNLMEFEDLHDVVLVGHSYGGLVVTGAADRVPERVSELVYLDTAPLPDGGKLIEKFPPELRERTEEQVRKLGDGWKFPIPPPEELASMASLQGVDEDRLRLLYLRATPQPFGTYTQALHLENPAREALPKLGILCSFSL